MSGDDGGGYSSTRPLPLKTAYAELLKGYTLILSKPQRPQLLMPVFVEAHIRRQLELIGKLFVYFQFDPSKPPGNRPKNSWLMNQKSKLETFTTTLTAASGLERFARLAVIAIPAAVTTLYALFGQRTDSSNTSSIVGFLPHLSSGAAVLLLLPIALTALAIGFIFSLKRSLFQSVKINGLNIYQPEDLVFYSIDVPKRREFPLDLSMYLLCSVLVIANFVAFSRVEGFEPGLLLALAPAILFGPYAIISWIRRTYW
jgi:hypothetical protein